MKILVVSPHRDDAAFSLGLAISRWLHAGHAVTVLNCFTQSNYAPYSDVELVHENDKASYVSALRRKEDLAWNKLLGGKVEMRDLDLMDAPLRLGCVLDEVFHVEIRPGDRALARIAGAIRKLTQAANAGGTAVLAPLAVGGHIDHRVARAAALEVLAGTQTPLAFYEDLPYVPMGVTPGLDEQLAGLSELALQPCFMAGEPEDAEAAVRLKRRMADCYDSQVDSEVAQMVAGFAQTYGGRERLWSNAAWRESGLAVTA